MPSPAPLASLLAQATVPVSPSSCMPTGTALDAWLGGLPEDGITLVQGPVGCGRTTFLRAVAEGMVAQGATVIWNGAETLHQGALPHVMTHGTLRELVAHVTSVPRAEDVVVIDDAGSYPHDGAGVAESAKIWGSLASMLVGRGAPTLLAARTRQVGRGANASTGMGRGAVFSATLILDLEPVARGPHRRGPRRGGPRREVPAPRGRRHQAPVAPSRPRAAPHFRVE